MKKGKIALLLAFACLQGMLAFAQNDSLSIRKDSALVKAPDSLPQRLHVAIFTPLYLDSAFDAAGNYRYNKQFPKFINPGLEFWEGAQIAIDSLQKEGVDMDIHVYDTRSTKNRFETVLAAEEIKSMNLLIGHVTLNEAVQLGRVAAGLNVPFINANQPNDVGTTNNPNFVILNSTLATHCAGLYKFMQKNFALSNIIVFRKKGAQEDDLRNYFMEVEKSTAGVPLKLKYVTLPNTFTQEHLQDYLDSNITNVCLVGSLDEAFGQTIAQQLATLSTSYTSTVIGMPTWAVLDFERPQFKGIEIYYSTPFYINPTDKRANSIREHFKNVFYSRPSDMVFRGYETLYHFAHLLQLHGSNVGSSLGEKKYTLFTDFDIQPVLDKKTMTLNYFENKKLYFVRKIDGVVKAVY
jgi:hypothetical protein